MTPKSRTYITIAKCHIFQDTKRTLCCNIPSCKCFNVVSQYVCGYLQPTSPLLLSIVLNETLSSAARPSSLTSSLLFVISCDNVDFFRRPLPKLLVSAMGPPIRSSARLPSPGAKSCLRIGTGVPACKLHCQ